MLPVIINSLEQQSVYMQSVTKSLDYTSTRKLNTIDTYNKFCLIYNKSMERQ